VCWADAAPGSYARVTDPNTPETPTERFTVTSYQVDSDAVMTATNSIRATIARLQGEVSGLMGQLSGLDGSWTGQAATAFHGAIADWRVTQQRIEESLAGLNQALGLAGQQYAEIEQANLRLFSR
jgi:WXG100 family type VII secretion target